MISVPQALDILKSYLPTPRIVYVSIQEVLSRRLAEDIYAPEPSPRFTNSAMDGFAVRWEDIRLTKPEAPILLQISGESQAGLPFEGTVGQGEAVRINTGAVIPEGADTVIRIEDTEDRDTNVLIQRCRKKSQDVRRSGEEFEQGQKIMEKGLVLKARHIALLSALGITSIPVYDRPKVSLLVTGTELARHDDRSIQPFQVRDANSPMLQGAVQEAGGILSRCLHVEDDFESTVNCMSRALDEQCDIILCSGGVSVGRHDHVKEAATKIGFEELFWRIRQKPGKPLYAAKRGHILLFGLPGNPVSAFMCFQNFVLPTLAALQGLQLPKQAITAESLGSFNNTGKRTNFLRVNLTRNPNTTPTFQMIDRQGSHMLTSIVNADGYIALEPGHSLNPGDLMDVYAF